jgi:hypothetical protein
MASLGRQRRALAACWSSPWVRTMTRRPHRASSPTATSITRSRERNGFVRCCRRSRAGSFSGGNVLIAILGVPFKCPPPRRGALFAADYLVDRGVRDASRIDVISAVETPIPVSPETSVAMVHALAERDIGFTGHETGMRRGEVVGLRWQDVDFDGRRLFVVQQITEIRGRLVVGTPKTGRGARVVHSTITRSTDCGLTKKSRHSNALPGAQPGMTPGWSSRMRTADGCDPSTSHGISKGSSLRLVYPRSGYMTSGTPTPASRSPPASTSRSCPIGWGTRRPPSRQTSTPT